MVSRSPKSLASTHPLTSWGVWVDAKPRGELQDASFAMQIAYSTLHYAKTRLVTDAIAAAIAEYTRGEVSKKSMTKPPKRRPRMRARGRKVAA